MAEQQGILSGIGRGLKGVLGGVGQVVDFVAPNIGFARKALSAANDELAYRVEQRERRNQALDDLPGLLGPQNLGIDSNDQVLPLPPEVAQRQEGERQRDILMALRDAAPQQFAGTVLNNTMAAPRAEERRTAVMKEMEALGFPLTQEGFQQYQAAKAGPVTQDQQLDRMLKQFQIKALQDSANRDAAERQEQVAKQGTSINSALNAAIRLSDANKNLEGSALESGGVGLDLRRSAVSLFGDALSFLGDLGVGGLDKAAAEAQENVKDFDSIKKESAVLQGKLISAMNAEGITVTRAAQKLIESQTPGSDISPGTNDSITKVLMQEMLAEADAKGIPLADRDAFEQRLQELNAAPLAFATEEEAQAAYEAGAIPIGQTFTINGEEASFENE